MWVDRWVVIGDEYWECGMKGGSVLINVMD